MTSGPAKICILGATFNTANLGVSVLAAGALRCVLHRFPEAKIIQLDYAQAGYDFQFRYEETNVDIRFVNIRFSKKFYLSNNIALLILLALLYRLLALLPRFRDRLVSRNETLRELLETDLVVSLAGGDSFSDIYGMRRLLYVSLPQILAILLKRRLTFLPQTIGPFRAGFAKRIASFILKRAELVYCRDRISEKVARSLLGVDADLSKVRLCYDVGFDVPPNASKDLALSELPFDGAETVVGFNVSGLLAMGGYSQNNMFGLQVPYQRMVLSLIEFLIEQRSASVMLVPHVFGSSSENDLDACERIFELLREKHGNKIGILRGLQEYGEVKHVVGKCDFFIGSRMHACIGALSQCVPAVSIAYSDKFIGVMEMVGVEDLVVDPRGLNEEQILSAVDVLFHRRAELRRELESRMPMVKQTIQSVLHDVELPGCAPAAVFAEV
jgi:colanic acid/amylovoran biosynthesis protein